MTKKVNWNFFFHAVVILSLSLVSACAQKTNIFGELNSDYHKLLKRQSITKKNISMEEVKYETTAIYWNPQLATAYAHEYARRFRLSQEETANMLNQQLEKAQSHHIFYIFHYASSEELSIISMSRTGNWRIKLIHVGSNQNEHLKPEKIEGVQENRKYFDYFFPRHSPWARVYRVYFEKNPVFGDPVILSLDNTEGNIEFKW